MKYVYKVVSDNKPVSKAWSKPYSTAMQAVYNGRKETKKECPEGGALILSVIEDDFMKTKSIRRIDKYIKGKWKTTYNTLPLYPFKPAINY